MSDLCYTWKLYQIRYRKCGSKQVSWGWRPRALRLSSWPEWRSISRSMVYVPPHLDKVVNMTLAEEELLEEEEEGEEVGEEVEEQEEEKPVTAKETLQETKEATPPQETPPTAQ